MRNGKRVCFEEKEYITNMNNESFFYAIKDQLCFKIKIPENRGEQEELGRVYSKEGRKYLLAYVEKEDFIENRYDIRKFSYKEYTDIVFDNVDISGVAIYSGEEYYYYEYVFFLQQQVKQEWEEFVDSLDRESFLLEEEREKLIKEYHQRRYNKYMEKVKKAWNLEAYERAYNILCYLEGIYSQRAGELLYYCGMVFERVGNQTGAEQLYREAVRSEPHNYWLYYQMAQFYRKMGRLDQEKRVYIAAYKHHRFCSNNNTELQNDGIQYVLNALVQHELVKKKLLEKSIYMMYAKEVDKKYAVLGDFETYHYLDD